MKLPLIASVDNQIEYTDVMKTNMNLPSHDGAWKKKKQYLQTSAEPLTRYMKQK
jgi:hypothetical protein